MLKELHFLISYDVILEYIYPIKECHNVLKNKNIFENLLKWFLVFIKFAVSNKHCDSIWLG